MNLIGVKRYQRYVKSFVVAKHALTSSQYLLAEYTQIHRFKAGRPLTVCFILYVYCLVLQRALPVVNAVTSCLLVLNNQLCV